MGFELVGGVIQPGFGGGDPAVDDCCRMNFPEAHQDKVGKAHRSAGSAGLNPEAQEVDEDQGDNKEKKDSKDGQGNVSEVRKDGDVIHNVVRLPKGWSDAN